jgi:hypothetical protein
LPLQVARPVDHERGWSSHGSQVGAEARRGRNRPEASADCIREEGETGAEARERSGTGKKKNPIYLGKIRGEVACRKRLSAGKLLLPWRLVSPAKGTTRVGVMWYCGSN